MTKTSNPYPTMIRILPTCLASCILFLTGCETTQLSIFPIPSNTLGDDPEVMVQEKTHRVSVELLSSTFSRKYDELPTFAIFVENLGERSILLTSGGIKLTSGNQEVPAYSLDEYIQLVDEAVKRESEEYSARQAEIALQGNSAQRTPEISDNSRAIAQISSAKMANNAAARRETARIVEGQPAEIISIHQLNSGESKLGLAKFHGEDIQADQPLKLIVRIEGEPYEFDFEVTAMEK